MLAIDRLKKLKASMLRLSSTDQYSATESTNQSKPVSTTSCTIFSRPPHADDNNHHPLLRRRSHSGENLATPSQEKSPPSHPPPAEWHPAVPQPELVTIQVNIASRSWTGKSSSVVDGKYADERPAEVTYESFYGNPLLDFHCLRKETDDDDKKKTVSSEVRCPDGTRGDDAASAAAFVGEVRLRTRLSQPTPTRGSQLNCRTRRASGGSSSETHQQQLGSSFDPKDSALFPAADKTSLELSRRPSSAGLSSSSRSVPNTPGKTSTKSTQPPAPPPPPMRTESVTAANSSSVEPWSGVHHRLSSGALVTTSGKRESSDIGGTSVYAITARFDTSADIGNAAIVSQTDNVFIRTAPSARQKVTWPVLGSCRENFQQNGSLSPDCSALPFANEDIGTIRQKPAGNFLHRTKVLSERDSLKETLDRDNGSRFVNCSEMNSSSSAGKYCKLRRCIVLI